MSEEKIESKINEWKKPIMVQVGSYRIRDIHSERMNPLQLDSRELHEAYVQSKKRGGSRNESQ
jgi:hypothetical protein